jgi:hypothetical protein
MNAYSTFNAWALNVALVIALIGAGATAHLRSKANAAGGGGWGTDGIMANPIDGDTDRAVVIDTDKKQIAVYKIQGTGQFRLIAARDYKYDMLLEDTSGVPEIENKNGITAFRAYQLWEEHRARNVSQHP